MKFKDLLTATDGEITKYANEVHELIRTCDYDFKLVYDTIKHTKNREELIVKITYLYHYLIPQ